MLTMRPLDAHDKWQGKTQKEYLRRKADEERGFTTQEFLQAKEDGWEKQYKCKNAAGVSAWLAPTQAAREPGWERCSKQPKAAKFGRQNPLCARWNSPEQLLDWREAGANAVNRAQKQESARITQQDYHAVTQQLADKRAKQEQLQTTRNTAPLLQIALRSSFLPPQSNTLKLRIKFNRKMQMPFTNTVLQ